MSVLYWPNRPSGFQSGPPCPPTAACDVMEAYIPNRNIKLPLRTYLKELTSETEDGNCQVFRAQLCEVLLLSTLERNVVCKVAYGQRRIDDLLREADFYNTKLLGLQGTVVPRMYGCYRGYTEDGHTAVLILEDCGYQLTYKLKFYDVAFRTQVVRAWLAVHDAGVLHNDFHSRNILVSRNADGSPRVRLIDFGLSSDHSTCPSAHEVDSDNLVPYQGMPEYFACKRIDLIFKERAEIWLPRTIRFARKSVPEEYLTSAEAVLDYTGVPSHMTIENARQYVQHLLTLNAKVWSDRLRLDANAEDIESEL
ncbi:hypothetical protein PYCCODRAFT_193010 [Trametes coccinea BRFM310]|uniref:Protein kinase domain-containing protein n=1 Tax=Trametes coccinea (strain BRFM310) TaxID=1353009 RepID=A0A1Y2ISZ2_TRAC3|nr:hypothetical protein PYCCODRAFT_193010 [Trametes coccinea BRFM310]